MVGWIFVTVDALAGSSFTVGSGEKYTTILSALSGMKDGDVCIIKEGVYRECIKVTQNKITLRGEGRVVITGCDEAGKPKPEKVNGQACLVFDVGKPVYDAFSGEQYLSMARFPNKTKSMTSNEDWAFATIDQDGDVKFTEPNLAVPQGLTDGYYVGAGSFNTKSRFLLFGGPARQPRRADVGVDIPPVEAKVPVASLEHDHGRVVVAGSGEASGEFGTKAWHRTRSFHNIEGERRSRPDGFFRRPQ
jgi:hypothetical protein